MRILKAFYIFFGFISVSRWTQVTALEEKEETDKQKPDLSCLLFGDLGCHITCRVKGNLYNSQINGYCTPNAHCVPSLIRSEELTRHDYENLPFETLWSRKFEPSTSATTVQIKLSQTPRLKEKIRQLLRNTRNTGQDIKHQLMATFPRWSTLRDLTPKRQGMVNDFVTNSYELDSEALSEIVKGRVAELCEQFTIPLNAQITRHLNRMTAENVKHIMKEVASLDEPDLYAQLRDYLRRRGHRVADEEFLRTRSSAAPQDTITQEDIDGMLTVAIVKAMVNRRKEENGKGKLTLPGVANEGNILEYPRNDYYYLRRGRPHLSINARLLYPHSTRYNDDSSNDPNPSYTNYYVRDTGNIPQIANETPSSDEYWRANYYSGHNINSNEYANDGMYQNLFDVELSNSEYCSCEEEPSVPLSFHQQEETPWEDEYGRNLARRSVDYVTSSYESSSSGDTSEYYADKRDIESLYSYSASSEYDPDEGKYKVEKYKKKKRKAKKHKGKKRKKKIHRHIDYSDDSSMSESGSYNDDCWQHSNYYCPYHGGGMGNNCW